MLAQHLQSLPASRRAQPVLVADGAALAWGALAERAAALAGQWRALAGRRVGLAFEAPADYLPAVVALDALGAHVFLAGHRDEAALAALARELRWDATLHGTADAPPAPGCAADPADAGLVTLLTSGTTGGPKAATHTWASLAGPVRRDPRYAGTRWLCAYPLNLYAGTQVMLQALLNWATLVTPATREPAAVARAMRDGGVTHAGGTPTFWRQLLLFAPREVLAACPLQQVTMGGEAVNQGVLDQLAAVFPAARLVHIYASTELGRLFSVTDRREGFPASYLAQAPEPGVALRINGEELEARSAHAMLGYEGGPRLAAGDGWIATGDLVERVGDRVLFRGRRTDVINVGGRKVLPARVEAAVREVPGVADVRAYGKGSSLAGQIVAVDVVLAAGSDRAEVLAALNRVARERLAQPEVPRLVRVVDAIGHSNAFKTVRTGEA